MNHRLDVFTRCTKFTVQFCSGSIVSYADNDGIVPDMHEFACRTEDFDPIDHLSGECGIVIEKSDNGNIHSLCGLHSYRIGNNLALSPGPEDQYAHFSCPSP
jgi:hypothetical protein